MIDHFRVSTSGIISDANQRIEGKTRQAKRGILFHFTVSVEIDVLIEELTLVFGIWFAGGGWTVFDYTWVTRCGTVDAAAPVGRRFLDRKTVFRYKESCSPAGRLRLLLLLTQFRTRYATSADRTAVANALAVWLAVPMTETEDI